MDRYEIQLKKNCPEEAATKAPEEAMTEKKLESEEFYIEEIAKEMKRFTRNLQSNEFRNEYMGTFTQPPVQPPAPRPGFFELKGPDGTTIMIPVTDIHWDRSHRHSNPHLEEVHIHLAAGPSRALRNSIQSQYRGQLTTLEPRYYNPYFNSITS